MFGTIFMLSGLVGTTIAGGIMVKEAAKKLSSSSHGSSFERISLERHLYKGLLISVNEACLHKESGIYFATVDCPYLKMRRIVDAKSLADLNSKIDAAVTEFSREIDSRK